MTYIENTLGAASIGFNIACCLIGVLTTQVFIYFKRFCLDKPVYKFLVSLLWTLALLDHVLIGYSIYYYSIKQYGHLESLLTGSLVWTFLSQIILACLIGTIVKCCFAMRVWIFSRENLYITATIIVMIFAQLGLAMGFCIKAFEMGSFAFIHELRVVGSIALGASVVTDLVIAVALCYFLRRLRTDLRKSNSTDILSTYAVGTGALTGAVALCTLVLYNTSQDTLFFVAFYFCLGKLYAISFLFTLNTRKAIRGRGTTDPAVLTVNSKSWHDWMPSTNRQPGTHKMYVKDLPPANAKDENLKMNHDHNNHDLESVVVDDTPIPNIASGFFATSDCLAIVCNSSSTPPERLIPVSL